MSGVAGFDAAAVAAALSWPAAVQALRAALAAGLDPEREPARSSAPFGAGELLTMPATVGDRAGVKLVTIAPHGRPRIHGLYVLFDAHTLAPVATLDGAALTALRTPAVSALGVDLVAPRDARRLVVFGSGPQARGHVHALRAVRPLESVTVVGRDAGRAAALVAALAADGLEAAAGPPAAVADADVIACCTTSRTPLFDGRRLSEQAVVVAVGSHEPDAREVDSDTVRRCGGVLVESRAAATREAGDVLLARAEGAVTDEDLVTFADLVGERTPRRPRFVKTVGMGWEDLVVAAAVVDGVAR